jgi:hypothetical protein
MNGRLRTCIEHATRTCTPELLFATIIISNCVDRASVRVNGSFTSRYLSIGEAASDRKLTGITVTYLPEYSGLSALRFAI